MAATVQTSWTAAARMLRGDFRQEECSLPSNSHRRRDLPTHTSSLRGRQKKWGTYNRAPWGRGEGQSLGNPPTHPPPPQVALAGGLCHLADAWQMYQGLNTQHKIWYAEVIKINKYILDMLSSNATIAWRPGLRHLVIGMMEGLSGQATSTALFPQEDQETPQLELRFKVTD